MDWKEFFVWYAVLLGGVAALIVFVYLWLTGGLNLLGGLDLLGELDVL